MPCSPPASPESASIAAPSETTKLTSSFVDEFVRIAASGASTTLEATLRAATDALQSLNETPCASPICRHHEARLLANTAAMVTDDTEAGRVFHNCDRRFASWVVASPAEATSNVVVEYPLMTALRGSSLFTTVAADVSLFRGRWMYEVVLCSEGLLQVGWTSPAFLPPFSSRLGVGDFPFTFSYDGNRQRAWNVTARACGVRWAPGDVITCLLDLDAGEARFLHNGKEAGRMPVPTLAGADLHCADPLVAYSPGVSLTYHETCMVNLGESYFYHPQPGYRSVNDAFVEEGPWVQRAHAFIRLLDDESPAAATLSALLLADLNTRDGSIYIPHVIAAFVHDLADKPKALVDAFQRRIDDVLCDAVRHRLLGTLIAGLCFINATKLVDGTNPKPLPHLQTLVHLVANPVIQAAWLRSASFVVDLLNVFRVKSPNNVDIETLTFPTPADAVDAADAADPSSTTQYFSERTRGIYENAIRVDDQRRAEVLRLLLTTSAASRSRTLEVLDVCIKEFVERPRTQQGTAQRKASAMNVGNALATRVFFALAEIVVDIANVTLGGDAARLAQHFLPAHVLARSSIEHLTINRIGGSIQHVAKRVPLSPETVAGTSGDYDPLLMKTCVLYTLAVKDRVMTACNSLMLRQRMQQGFRTRGETPSLHDLLRATFWDAATLFYCGRNPTLIQLSGVIVKAVNHYFGRPEFQYVPIILVECFVDALHFARKTSPTYRADLLREEQCVHFFVDKFLHPSVTNSETSEYMMLSLGAIVDSVEGNRSAVVEILRRHDESSLLNFVMLTFNQFSHRMAWTLPVGILVRLNVGNGFNMIDLEEEQIDWGLIFPGRTAAAPAFTSHAFYADLIRKYLVAGPWRTNANKEINGRPKQFFADLVDHANWSLSELGAALADIKVVPDSALTPNELNKRRRCVSLFDLTRKLLHILEFFIEVAFDLFFESPASPSPLQSSSLSSMSSAATSGSPSTGDDFGDRTMNTSMVIEVLTQSLARFSSPLETNHLNRVAALQLQGMERIRQWKLLAPIVGIVHSMLRGGRDLSPATNPFLRAIARPGIEWSVESIEHAFGAADWSTTGAGANVDKSAFTRDPRVLSALREAHSAHKRGAKLDEDDDGLVEEGLCLICAFQPINTTFVPCGHQSCGTCIRRHLLTAQTCFFCNKKIEELSELATIVAGPATSS